MNHDPDALAEDLTGQTLGDYRIIRRLGRGGMADVYLAEQLSLKRKVAFKVLKPELARDKTYVARFHREAQAAAALVQANIVQIYEVGDESGWHFIAQEYVPGRNLRQYIGRHGAVEPLMALNVLRQVAQALKKAAEMGVVHRDIKPENIMISSGGEVKVTDFGLARLITEQDAQGGLTQIGVTMGTPLYMSPEQAEGGKIDTRSDIYSLGATAYHMLAGNPPFEGENALAIAVKQINQMETPLSVLRPDSPELLNDLVHRMMSKKPDQRPADPSVLLKELRKIRISEDDWEHLVEKLAERESHDEGDETVPEARLAATRQLQAVMRGHIDAWWNSRKVWGLLATAGVLAVVAGISMALANPPKYLLEGVESRAISEAVARQDTVADQYRLAFWASGDREKYWKAVGEYFPVEEADDQNRNQTRYYNQLANERLGEYYLESGELDKALEIYDRFANTADISQRVNVIGWAGQALVFDKRNQPAEAREALDRISLQFDQLSDYFLPRIRLLLFKYRQPGLAD